LVPGTNLRSATGKAELLFWPGQKRAGAATGPEGQGPRGRPEDEEKVAGTENTGMRNVKSFDDGNDWMELEIGKMPRIITNTLLNLQHEERVIPQLGGSTINILFL
jgi:hypothetical protein